MQYVRLSLTSQTVYNVSMENKYPFTEWPALSQYGKKITVSGGTIFYYDCNSFSNQTLVLIHGLGDEADTWRHVIPLLTARGYRCIAIDLPGFGRSEWRGKIDVKCHANAVVKVMTECGIGAPAENGVVKHAVLIGSSMGGCIAEYAAFMRPDLTQFLILIGGCVPVKGKTNPGMLLMGLPFLGRIWYRGFRKNHEGAWKSLYPYYHDLDAMSDEDKTFIRGRVIARVESDNQERGYFLSMRSMISTFFFAKGSSAKKIKMFNGKVTLIWGEHDHVMPVETTAVIRKLRLDAPLKIVADAGHLPHQEKPAESAEVILSLLE